MTPKASLKRTICVSVCLPVMVALQSSALSAQQLDLTEADKEKLATLAAFLENIDGIIPTINQIDPASLPVTIPYREIQNHVVIDVAFGDDDPVPLMFDTGAPTILTPEITAAHGGEVLAEMGSAAGGGGILWNPMVKIPSLTIGGLEIRNASAETGWSPAGAFYCITRNGLLGAPAMRNAVWQVDYGAQEIHVAATVDELDHVEGAIALPFTWNEKTISPSPVVELGIGEGTLTFIVDTGGGIPLTVNAADFATTGLKVPEDAPTSATLTGGAAGTFEATVSGVTLPIRFGETEITTTVIVGDGMAPTTQGNMGHGFLKNFVVTFDWATRTMYLDPLSDDGSVPRLGDGASVGLAHDGERVYVSALAKGGPAESAGLTLGEKVARVNGEDVSDMPQADFCGVLETTLETVTTDGGNTYDAGKIKGFFSGN